MNGFKTMIVALLITIFGALEAFDFTTYLDGDTAGYVTTGIGVVMMILRAVTKSPVFKNTAE